jgi:hypothetical protein
MNAAAMIAAMRKAGASISLHVEVDGPASALPEGALDEIRANKPELLRSLSLECLTGMPEPPRRELAAYQQVHADPHDEERDAIEAEGQPPDVPLDKACVYFDPGFAIVEHPIPPAVDEHWIGSGCEGAGDVVWGRLETAEKLAFVMVKAIEATAAGVSPARVMEYLRSIPEFRRAQEVNLLGLLGGVSWTGVVEGWYEGADEDEDECDPDPDDKSVAAECARRGNDRSGLEGLRVRCDSTECVIKASEWGVLKDDDEWDVDECDGMAPLVLHLIPCFLVARYQDDLARVRRKHYGPDDLVVTGADMKKVFDEMQRLHPGLPIAVYAREVELIDEWPNPNHEPAKAKARTTA